MFPNFKAPFNRPDELEGQKIFSGMFTGSEPGVGKFEARMSGDLSDWSIQITLEGKAPVYRYCSVLSASENKGLSRVYNILREKGFTMAGRIALSHTPATRAPRLGCARRRPSWVSWSNASLTGPRLTWKRSAKGISLSGSPSLNLPVMISSRSLSVIWSRTFLKLILG